jgi:hypothetical protein
MIWLTWRQQRLEFLIGGALIFVVAVLVIRTGLDLRSAYSTLGINACLGQPHVQDPACQNVLSTFQDKIVNLSSELIFYHPAGRFWLFQGIESAIFVSLSVALLAGTVWWMRFRVT